VFAVAFTGWHGLNRPELEGEWEIMSVHRDGALESTQVGARVTFSGNTVTFQPRAAVYTAVPQALLDGTR
jgi:hypothetical protein